MKDALDIKNVWTNFTGLLPDIRIVSVDEWSDHYFHPVKNLLGSLDISQSKAMVGQWIVQLKTNDAHINTTFQQNFAGAEMEPKADIFCYALNDIENESFLKNFHDVKGPASLDKFIEQTSQILSLRPYKEGLTDNKYLTFDKIPNREKTILALRKSSAMYVPQLRIFVMINVTGYQVLRNQGCFGALKHLISMQFSGEQEDTDTSKGKWYPVNASAIQFPIGTGETCSALFFCDDENTMPSLSFASMEISSETKILSAGPIYINSASKKALSLEKRFYVPGISLNYSRDSLHSAFEHEIENLTIPHNTGDTDEGFNGISGSMSDAVNSILQQSRKGNRVYAIVDPSDIWNKERTAGSAKINSVFIVSKNPDDNRIIIPLSCNEAVGILTSQGNVPVYAEPVSHNPDVQPLYRLTIPWFDSNRLFTIDNSPDDSDKAQNSILKSIFDGSMEFCFLNARIPIPQLALCASGYIYKLFRSVELKNPGHVNPMLCAKLRILKKESRTRGYSKTALFVSDGTEVNVLAFIPYSGASYYAAFDINKDFQLAVKSYSRGTLQDFHRHHRTRFASNPEEWLK